MFPFQFNSTNQMSGCKARKCIRNNDINRITMTGTVWNDFQRCNKKVYKDGFCRRCYEPDRRYKHPCWIEGPLWKRDGIYGEPYDFPYHINTEEKKWVKGIYNLHPEIRPPDTCELDELISNTLDEDTLQNEYEQKQIAVKEWLEKYSSKIDYKIGKELEEILRK